MDENTLIIRAKRGNKKAIETLTQQYQPMVGKIASQFHYPRDDYEDIIQEGCIGILQALQEYTPTGRCDFAQLATLKIHHNIFNFTTRNNTVSGRYKKKSEIVVEFVGDILSIKPPPDADDAMVYEYVIQELINEVFTLDDFRRFLISRKYGLFGHFPLTMKGLKSEANKRFNNKLTESQIKNKLVYAVRKLRKALKEKGIEGGDAWKIKNKLLQRVKTKRQEKKRQNCLKITNGEMVVSLARITKSYWSQVCFSHLNTKLIYVHHRDCLYPKEARRERR